MSLTIVNAFSFTGLGIGKYMFIEASSPRRLGDKARLRRVKISDDA